jgi:hypothetical protein
MRLPFAEQLTTARVLVAAFPVEIAIRTVQLPRLVRWLGFTLATSSDDLPGEPAAGTPAMSFDPAEWRQVRVVLRVMRHWPFGPGSCLRQALLLGHLLRARHPVLYLGVSCCDQRFTAHAWIQVSGLTIGEHEGVLPLVLPVQPKSER